MKRTLYNLNPLDEWQEFDSGSILEFYNARKEKTIYDASTIVQPLGSSTSTTIEVTVRIPPSQLVTYIPGTLETLKFAWTQYQSFLIPAFFIYWGILGFLFKYQVLETKVVGDLDEKRRIS